MGGVHVGNQRVRRFVKYFVHGLLFSLLFLVLVIAWALLLLILVRVGSLLGLVLGLAILFIFMGWLNALITAWLWYPVKRGWKNNLLHGFVLFISLLIVSFIFVLPPRLMFPGLATTLVTFLLVTPIDGFVAQRIAGIWRGYPEPSLGDLGPGPSDSMGIPVDEGSE